MSLYDDEDTERRGGAATVGAGWSSGIRLLQSQLKLKKAATPSQPKREIRKPVQILPPVIDLKSKRDDEEGGFAIQTSKVINVTHYGKPPPPIQTSSTPKTNEYDWSVIGEYDPMWPNDYGKMVRELRLQRDRDTEKYDDKDKKSHRKRKSRFGDSDDYVENLGSMQHRHQDDDIERSPPVARTGGAAIAPPPSLQEPEPHSPPQVQIPSFDKPDKPLLIPPAGNYSGNSVAAKIMAKYGFKEGQGLGKKEQGMSMALQVEKTSKRGGRIIHEKDGSIMPPPLPIGDFFESPIPPSDSPGVYVPPKSEPSITEIMKSPSKVVLLRNMVGSGDVDEELEPEVKDECNSKYGDVIKVIIFEIPEASPDEAVRIFVEFKRIESAIKAVVDLNGRFFGGRQVKAGFYNVEKFANLQLLD